jgi:hypothetical protein
MWSHHSVVLKGSHGIFAVDDAPYERPDLAGNREFGSRGFLRCWMSSNRLLLIQNREGSSDYRYNAWINCDTNFVSFCEAFQAGRDLGALSDSFREAVTFLLPRAQTTNPIPYMLENASNPNMHKVHDTLRAFAAFQLTNAATFERSAHFDVSGSGLDPNKVADGWMKEMGSSEFKTSAAWAKKHFLWCRVVLIKAALLVFQGPSTVEDRFYAMLKFLHEKFARIRDFEMFVAYRYFALSSNESFFNQCIRTREIWTERCIRWLGI